MNIENKGQRYITKLLMLLNIGIVESLKQDILTVDDVEKLLYSPDMMDLLKKNKYPKEVINTIHQGTELEDVLSLGLNYEKALNSILELSVDILSKQTELKGSHPRWMTQDLLDKYVEYD